MKYNRKELKIIEHDSNSIANRLQQSVMDDFPHNLVMFINYIDDKEIISEYIRNCGEPDPNVADRIKDVASAYGNKIFDLGNDMESEVVTVYSILHHLKEIECAPLRSIIIGYALGSDHYDDCLRSFNNRVSAILII